MDDGIKINSNRGGTIYRDKDGKEIPAPGEKEKASEPENDFEKQDVNEDE